MDIRNLLKRAIEYSLFSLCGTIVDTLILWVCSHFLFDGYYWGEYLLSPVISFLCAVTTNFALSYFVIWRDRISNRGTRKSLFRHYIAYVGSCLVGFCIKMCFLLLIKHFFNLDVVLCNLIALCFSGLYNFFMNERVIFRHTKQ